MIADDVGSVPAEVPAEPEGVMRWLLDRAGGHELTALPCEDPRTVFEVVVDGVATRYENVPPHRVARGVALKPEHVALGRVQQVAERPTVHVPAAFGDQPPARRRQVLRATHTTRRGIPALRRSGRPPRPRRLAGRAEAVRDGRRAEAVSTAVCRT